MFDNKKIQTVLIVVRHCLIALRNIYLRKMYKMKIGNDVRISLRANLDKRNPKGVIIGEGSYVAFGAVILAHDMSRNITGNVEIGRNCFIGANSIILPNVKIGDEVVVAAGSVVTKNIASNTMAGGNPARTIRSGIKTIKWGRLVEY